MQQICLVHFTSSFSRGANLPVHQSPSEPVKKLQGSYIQPVTLHGFQCGLMIELLVIHLLSHSHPSEWVQLHIAWEYNFSTISYWKFIDCSGNAL